MLDILDRDIGGARVRRTFTNGEHRMHAGDHLTAEQVLNIPVANRRALTDSNFLEIFPKAASAVPAEDLERVMIAVGNNEFNVIEGKFLSDKPLSKKDAERLVRA